MTDIKSMNQEELSSFLKELGQPAFRAKQVFSGSTGASAPLTR